SRRPGETCGRAGAGGSGRQRTAPRANQKWRRRSASGHAAAAGSRTRPAAGGGSFAGAAFSPVALSRSVSQGLLVAHVLVGKPVSTFPQHVQGAHSLLTSSGFTSPVLGQ